MKPPSIGTTSPVTNAAASSSSSQSRVPRRSSGRPKRRIGVWLIIL